MAFLVSLGYPGASFGDEIVPIGKILANPPLFATHLTTFRGIVMRLDALARIPTKSCYAQDRYHAVIEDDTGSIDAIVCGAPLDELGPISLGSRVVLRALIHVTEGVPGQPPVLAEGVRMERAIERP